jgi:hypothetical protein
MASSSLKAFCAARGTYLHVSAAARMIPHPLNPTGPNVFPWVQKPGRTYNVGRNTMKRVRRAMHGVRK